jgi:hypothetical protein
VSAKSDAFVQILNCLKMGRADFAQKKKIQLTGMIREAYILNLIQLFNAYFFDLWLPDLVRHPGWRTLWFAYLQSLSRE